MRRTPRGLLAVLAAGMVLAGCGAPGPDAHGPGAELGVEVLGVELLAGGDLAKLSYRVVDYEKATRALHQELRLVAAEAADRRLEVTSLGRLGPMRQRPSRSARTQFVIFTNTGRALARGSTASLVVGATRIDGIPIS